MATTRKKPATATKAAAARKPATKAGNLSSGEATTATAIAVAEAPAPRAPAAAEKPVAPVKAPAGETKQAGSPNAASPNGIERRRSPREKLVAPAGLHPASGDSTVDRGVQVQDLSLGGVGFVSPEKMDPGEVFRITLGKGPLLLNARVRIISCNKTGHRMYRCGAEFC